MYREPLLGLQVKRPVSQLRLPIRLRGLQYGILKKRPQLLGLLHGLQLITQASLHHIRLRLRGLLHGLQLIIRLRRHLLSGLLRGPQLTIQVSLLHTAPRLHGLRLGLLHGLLLKILRPHIRLDGRATGLQAKALLNQLKLRGPQRGLHTLIRVSLRRLLIQLHGLLHGIQVSLRHTRLQPHTLQLGQQVVVQQHLGLHIGILLGPQVKLRLIRLLRHITRHKIQLEVLLDLQQQRIPLLGQRRIQPIQLGPRHILLLGRPATVQRLLGLLHTVLQDQLADQLVIRLQRLGRLVIRPQLNGPRTITLVKLLADQLVKQRLRHGQQHGQHLILRPLRGPQLITLLETLLDQLAIPRLQHGQLATVLRLLGPQHIIRHKRQVEVLQGRLLQRIRLRGQLVILRLQLGLQHITLRAVQAVRLVDLQLQLGAQATVRLLRGLRFITLHKRQAEVLQDRLQQRIQLLGELATLLLQSGPQRIIRLTLLADQQVDLRLPLMQQVIVQRLHIRLHTIRRILLVNQPLSQLRLLGLQLGAQAIVHRLLGLRHIIRHSQLATQLATQLRLRGQRLGQLVSRPLPLGPQAGLQHITQRIHIVDLQLQHMELDISRAKVLATVQLHLGPQDIATA